MLIWSVVKNKKIVWEMDLNICWYLSHHWWNTMNHIFKSFLESIQPLMCCCSSCGPNLFNPYDLFAFHSLYVLFLFYFFPVYGQVQDPQKPTVTQNLLLSVQYVQRADQYDLDISKKNILKQCLLSTKRCISQFFSVGSCTCSTDFCLFSLSPQFWRCI